MEMCSVASSALCAGAAPRGTHRGEAVVLAGKKMPPILPKPPAVGEAGARGGGLRLPAKPSPP